MAVCLAFRGRHEIPASGHLPAEYFSEVLAVSRRRGLCLALCQTAVSVRETPFVYDFQRHFRPRFVTSFLPLNMRKPCKFPKLTRLSRVFCFAADLVGALQYIRARVRVCEILRDVVLRSAPFLTWFPRGLVTFARPVQRSGTLFSHGFSVYCDFFVTALRDLLRRLPKSHKPIQFRSAGLSNLLTAYWRRYSLTSSILRRIALRVLRPTSQYVR